MSSAHIGQVLNSGVAGSLATFVVGANSSVEVLKTKVPFSFGAVDGFAFGFSL